MSGDVGERYGHNFIQREVIRRLAQIGADFGGARFLKPTACG
jgi:hypothetical protein